MTPMEAIHDAGPNDWAALPIAETYTPRILPASWRDVTPKGFVPFGKAFVSTAGLRVILSAEQRTGDDTWLHVSVAREDRLPSWEDLKDVKDLFIGQDKTAIQILPKTSEFVNYHRYVLHLWCNLDKERFVPDFRRKGIL